jgi:ABC-type Mn2+/Zn2+ transport system permease subunit
MLDQLLTPALLTSTTLAIACAVLSVFVVLRRWSFIGEGISHSSFGGAGTAWMLGLLFPALEQSRVPYVALLVVAFSFTTAMVIGAITRQQQVNPDAAIGIFLVSSLAWGFLAQGIYFHLRHAVPAGWDTFLFGDIEHLDRRFAVAVAVLSAAVICIVWVLGKELLYCAFDADMAETSGVRSGVIHYLLLGLLAMVIVVGVQVAGSVLIPAMLILPGTIALLLTQKLQHVFVLAIGVGLLGALGGLLSHQHWIFVPIGPAIVLTLFVLFVSAWVYRWIAKRPSASM